METLIYLKDDIINNHVLKLGFLLILVLGIYMKLKDRIGKNIPPGPTGFPFIGYLPFLGKEPHLTFQKLSKTYGPIFSVRLGKDLTIVLNDWKSVKEVLLHPSSLDKPDESFHFIPSVGFETFNGDEWEEQRRFCIQTMKALGLGRGSWEKLIQDEVQIFVKDVDSYDGKPFDIAEELSASISSNIVSLLIGRRLDKKSEAGMIKLGVEYVSKLFVSTSPSRIASIVPGVRACFEFFGVTGYYDVTQLVDRFFKFLRKEMMNHKSVRIDSGQTDFINLYLNKMEEKQSEGGKHYFSDKNLEGNLNILYLAASDTIISSLKWAFRLMAAFPESQRNVQEELDEIIGQEGQVTYSERVNIPYTVAVLMEAQRYSSIVVIPQSRRARNDFVAMGYTIPKGSRIMSNLYAIHNDPHYWNEPRTFNPQRFLTGKKIVTNPDSYLPFSLGRRNCPGEVIAWMEMLTYFTQVLQKFTIRLEEGVDANFESYPGLVSQLKSQSLCFIKRNRI